MNKIIPAAILVAFSALSSSSWGQTITVDSVSYPNQKWHINRLMATETGTGWRISGRLNAYPISNLPTGHIDVAAYTHDGQLLGETTAAHTPSILTPKMRKKGGLHFSATLDQSLPVGAVVKVAFHPSETTTTEIKPTHTANIAR